MAISHISKIDKEFNKDEIMKNHDFNYIREHFYDKGCTLDDVRGDILEVYNDNLELQQLSAEGKNTVRVTNYFVMETQMKATTIRSKMSPHDALYNDDALCNIFYRIDTHPRFFNIRKGEEERLQSEGLSPDILEQDTSKLEPLQRRLIEERQAYYRERINLADVRELRRAMAQMPAYGRVSQFPNHVAQRIYEKYCPKENAIILDSSAGWGNRMMAAMSSKFNYKYLATDPNSEMHPNYRALANTIYETVYKGQAPGEGRNYPYDYIDIRDQGSEFDVPEWHGMSGYNIMEQDPEDEDKIVLENVFTGDQTELTRDLSAMRPSKEKHGIKHPDPVSGKGCCDTGELATTGANLEPIWHTHSPEIFNSGIGDLSFTSPPYFFLECYTEDSKKGNLATGQSAGKGSNYRQWIKDFVYPTVVNHFNYLKPGGYYVFNLKDLEKEKLWLYADWTSVCLDVGFELISNEVMTLKARRQFGKTNTGDDVINFKGATEKIAVLRKPLTPDAPTVKNDSMAAIYHIKNRFIYPLISECRPDKFQSHLPKFVEDYLIDKFKIHKDN